MQVTAETTVGEIVARDFRTAAVFHAFGIDYCCGGSRTVAGACVERNIDTNVVMSAVERVCELPGSSLRFNEWEPETLVGFIVGNHHAYVRRALPSLMAHTRRIAAVHGENHPQLDEVARLADDVANEMISHMAKEERVLFPYIVALADAVRHGKPAPRAPFGPIDNPIRMMEHEHKAAGAAMARIRELTQGYNVPEDGCSTYRACMHELDAFERDLHAHVHLENNILFPRARALAAR
jgi:regulator of cell morphogenesis and NO signaling